MFCDGPPQLEKFHASLAGSGFESDPHGCDGGFSPGGRLAEQLATHP